MILVIPSIELKGGFCTQCIIGEVGTEGYYQRLSRDPVELVKLLRRENTKTIHIIDGDSLLMADNSTNLVNIQYISEVLDIPVEVYSKFDTYEKCESMFKAGVYRLILDELLLIDSKAVADLVAKYTPSRFVFNMQIDENNRVKIGNESINYTEYSDLIKSISGRRILYSPNNNNISEDKFIFLSELYEKYRFSITIGEMINNPEELWKLSSKTNLGIDSVIIGKALYDNNFPCQKIWRLIEAKQEPISQ